MSGRARLHTEEIILEINDMLFPLTQRSCQETAIILRTSPKQLPSSCYYWTSIQLQSIFEPVTIYKTPIDECDLPFLSLATL